MTVATILKHKGRLVETTRPGTTVGAAAEQMTHKGVGCLLVREPDGPVLGILSERDVVRGMAVHGPEVFDLPVRQVMTVKVWTCAPHDDVKKAMEIMTIRRIRHLPVIERGEVCGLVSIGDVVKSRLDEAELEVNVLRDYARSH